MRVRRSAAVMAMAWSSLGVRLRYTEPPMLELGQVILGVRDLDAASRRMEGLGFTVLDGGVHPGLGTANRIIPLGRQYLELLGVVDPALASAQWYGQALLARIADGDRLVRWSLRTDQIEKIAGALGLVPEPVSYTHLRAHET